MGWEDRNGRLYYYRKRREGRRVISEYVGSGISGEFAQIFDNEDKYKADAARAQGMKQQSDVKAIDIQVSEIEGITQAFTRAALLLAGYHAPRRQWRKKRNGNNKRNTIL